MRALLFVGLAMTLAGVVPGRAVAQGRSELGRGRPIEGEILVKYRPGVGGMARAEARSALGNGTRKLNDFEFIR
ncbi:MAG: hypothetical protein ABIP29_11345, partial [Candidatus Eisenbacteria bacterium]